MFSQKVIARAGLLTAMLAFVAVALGYGSGAEAHVKWFAPYIVGAAPKPVSYTLHDGWFWLGIGIVLAFFLIFGLTRQRCSDQPIIPAVSSV